MELATLEWMDRLDQRQLLEVIENRPPAELEATYNRAVEHAALDA